MAALRGPGRVRKTVDLVAFPAVVAVRLMTMRRRPDVVMCSTVPQVTLGFAVALACRVRRSDFLYHCMDLHPEIGRLSGEFANPVVYRLLAAMDRAAMRRASRIIVLSEDMRAAVARRDPALARRVVVLNNFSLPSFAAPVPAPLGPPEPDTLRVLFAGNIGRFQGLEAVIDALALLPPSARVELVFMGEGKAKAALREQVASTVLPEHVSVRFLDHGPAAQAKALMETSDLGIVSLMPQVVRFAFPSKTATYAEAGLPMLVVVEPESELARKTVAHGLGWSVPAQEPADIARALTAAAAEKGDGRLAARSAAVKRYALEQYGEAAALERWWGLLDDVVREREGRRGGG